MENTAKLKKELGLLDVFSVAAGAMISSGLFVLPAIAFRQGGPSIVASYILASLLILPSVLTKAELVTAMPKAGGTYFYVERSLGGLWGIFCGLANWFSLALKSAFAIVGIALFIRMFCLSTFSHPLSNTAQNAIAVGFCICFAALNIISTKHATGFQNLLVIFLIGILGLFVVLGISHVQPMRFENFAPYGRLSILTTAGAVFVSFGGLTQVDSISEEVRHPGKLMPIGMILAWLIVSILYAAVVFITVGVLDAEILANSDAPISSAANAFLGRPGLILLSLAALAAFITTANGGILSASRSPMAMSRDHLLPPQLARIHKRLKTPVYSILLTGVFIIAAITCLELELLVKTASAMLLLLFLLDNASVIIMRQSKLQSYRPKFKAPFYPWLQTITILVYLGLLVEMGLVPLLITGVFLAISVIWYFIYARKRVQRDSAVMHVVQRVTDKEITSPTLENELRDILFERDNIIVDRFDQLLNECTILDIEGTPSAETVFEQAATVLADKLGTDKNTLIERFMQREAEGSTILETGLAIPHVVIEGEKKFDVLPVRAAGGIDFPHAKEPVKTIFFLAGTRDERNYHLRALMAIAQIVQEKDFYARWFAARDSQSLRNLLLLSKRKRDTAQ